MEPSDINEEWERKVKERDERRVHQKLEEAEVFKRWNLVAGRAVWTLSEGVNQLVSVRLSGLPTMNKPWGYVTPTSPCSTQNYMIFLWKTIAMFGIDFTTLLF